MNIGDTVYVRGTVIKQWDEHTDCWLVVIPDRRGFFKEIRVWANAADITEKKS
jgi:hypothetical protein